MDSLAAPVSLINALIVSLCLKQPDTVKQGLEALEDAWNNYQVYLNDEIDYIDEETPFRLPGLEAEGEERKQKKGAVGRNRRSRKGIKEP